MFGNNKFCAICIWSPTGTLSHRSRPPRDGAVVKAACAAMSGMNLPNRAAKDDDAPQKKETLVPEPRMPGNPPREPVQFHPNDKVFLDSSGAQHARRGLGMWEGSAHRVSGRPNSGRWVAVAKQVLNAKGYAYTSFRLAKWGGFACVGLTRAGKADNEKLLCYQANSVSLDTNSSFYVHGKKVMQLENSIVQGSLLRIEWKAREGLLAFWLDCDKLFEHQGDFTGWSFAVSGYDDFIAWEVNESEA